MEKQVHLLVVDDDVEIRNLLEQLLRKYNYRVSTACDGEKMFSVLKKQTIDLILLDVMLPGDDGFVLCQKLRAGYNIPIIMLTAIGETTDRIVGLEMGADDYLTKPFNTRELLARIKAVIRRTHNTPSSDGQNVSVHRSVVEFAGWKLRKATRVLMSPDEVEVALSAGEYDLLCAFIEYPQQVLSRDQLLDNTKNRSAGPFDRSIDIQVSRLRYKIEEDPKNPKTIKTVRGGGYFFSPRVKNIG